VVLDPSLWQAEQPPRKDQMATANTIETLLNEHDVARITGLSVASVRRWRLLKQGPRYVKLSSAVRYRAEDVRAWLESRPTGGEQQGAR
jgi:predicted DNA-binding transcriptional regulator AlpA